MYHRCSTIRNKCIELSFFNFKKAPPACLPIAMLAIQLLGSIEGFVWEIIDPSCHLYRILGSCSWSHVTRYRSAVLPPKKQHDPAHIHPTCKQRLMTDIVLQVASTSKSCFESQVPSTVPYVHTHTKNKICTENSTKGDSGSDLLVVSSILTPNEKNRGTETNVTHLYCNAQGIKLIISILPTCPNSVCIICICTPHMIHVYVLVQDE